ncbi:MAG: hypothetical protein Kow0013_14360 [Pararhodobacter sp.]
MANPPTRSIAKNTNTANTAIVPASWRRNDISRERSKPVADGWKGLIFTIAITFYRTGGGLPPPWTIGKV